MEDTKIIELYWRRDESAIDETDRKYGRSCCSIAYDILSSREDSEECVNDTYMAAWNSIPLCRPSKLPAYLYRVTRNICFDRVKKRLASKRGGGETAVVLDEISECVAADASVERDYEAKELAAEINSFLRTLSADDRVIFNARYWLMLPSAEIARRLSCGESRVNTSLYRSRRKLHQYLKQEGLL